MSAIHLLVNPTAGGGHARRRARDARDALEAIGVVAVHETRGPGDETRIALEAHRAGARALVVLGGDGTVSHTARALVAAKSALPLALFAAGTGNDFARSVGVPAHDFVAMSRLIDRGRHRRIDVGSVDGIPFVNAAGFGFDAEVVARLGRGRRRAGRATYLRASVHALCTYGGFHAEVTTTAGAAHAHRSHLMLVFANGRFFGGAFHIAPRAQLDDGLLDLIAICNAGTSRRLVLLARALGGSHVGCREVTTLSKSAFELVFEAPSDFEADGELHRARGPKVAVECLPGALTIVAS